MCKIHACETSCSHCRLQLVQLSFSLSHTVVFFAISLGVFADLDQDFAGFFSREGIPEEGCLSYSFGISLAAFIVNIIASVVGVVAVFNPQIQEIQRSKYE